MAGMRSIFSFLLLVAMLPYTVIASVPVRVPERAASRTFVNIYIDQVKILKSSGDVSGPGEFRLIVLAADTTGKSSNMYCPGSAPLKMRKGDVFNTPCLLAISFDESKVSDSVYLTIMVVDEDKSALPSDLSYGAVSSALGVAFGNAVKKGLPKVGLVVLKKSTPFAIGVDFLFGLVSGKVKEWIERADVIGSQGIYLSRNDNWAADKTTTVTSSDGGIRLTYTVVHTYSAPPNPKGPVLGASSSSSSGSSSSSSSSTSGYWCDDLNLVKLKVGDRAKVVWMKVNLRTAPIVPQEYYENSIAKVDEGSKLTIIGGPACAHNGTWWQVRTSTGKVGWMREHISSGYLIGK